MFHAKEAGQLGWGRGGDAAEARIVILVSDKIYYKIGL